MSTKTKKPFSLTIGVHVGRRLMSRCQPATEYFDTLEEARSAFDRFKSGYVAGAPYSVRGIEWASICENGKEVWREQGLPANL